MSNLFEGLLNLHTTIGICHENVWIVLDKFNWGWICLDGFGKVWIAFDMFGYV